MSECITRVEKIDKIEPHFNADKLEVAHVKGWHCIVPKGQYIKGDSCVYFPIDSVLPGQLVETLFTGAKVSLPKGRVKTIRLRGLYSQGLVANLDTIREYLGNHGKHKKFGIGEDLTESLGVTKFEPKVPSFQQFQGKSTRKNQNGNFKKYKGIENIKNYNDMFEDDDDVVVTEKIHGTNFRAGWVKRHEPEGKLAKLWYNFRMATSKKYAYEWAVGSHNVQLDPDTKGNLYCDTARDMYLKTLLKKGEVIYGEIYGPNIQVGYHYGLKEGNSALVVFDLRRNGEFLEYEELKEYAEGRLCLEMPTELYRGKFKDLNTNEIVLGDSIFRPAQKVREGGVIQTVKDKTTARLKSGRKKLKLISPDYLMRSKSDFH